VGVEVRSLVSPEIRGLTRYTTNLLRGLSDRDDIDLVLFCREALHPAHLDGIDAEIIAGTKDREALWYDRWLAGEIRNANLDVFHAPADRGLPIRGSCPKVVTIHSSFERRHWRQLFPTLKQRLWYWRHEYANRTADAIVTVSETTRRELIEAGYDDERIHAIHLAAALPFSDVPEDGDASVLATLEVQQPYFLCVSGYNDHKNLDVLVEAFAATSLRGHELVIVADHRWNFELHRSRWSRLEAFERIRLIETGDAEIAVLYRHCVACVNPSRWESFGLQLVEAMACGAPVISSNAHALPEVAADAAMYFDPDSPDQLSQLMRIAAHDKDRLEAVRTAGRHRRQKFSWSETVRRTVGVYQRVIAH